jgi:GT2 family glycosyltransferase
LGSARIPVDILIPTYRRPAALAVLLTSLVAQTWREFRVVISDQTPDEDAFESEVVQAAVRVLRVHGTPVETYRHLPARGLAEQRQFLLDQAQAPYALFLDDDLILEPYVVETMLKTIRAEGCGFVGSALIGLSFINDVRPDEQTIEFWDGPVQPEEVRPGSPAWERYRLHNAANVLHVQERLELSPECPRPYKVAWVGGCVMYNTARLRAVGGFHFWRELPPQHAGEDVLAQLRVMAAYGGCGILPSGAYHQELPTTVTDRLADAPRLLDVRVTSEGDACPQPVPAGPRVLERACS